MYGINELSFAIRKTEFETWLSNVWLTDADRPVSVYKISSGYLLQRVGYTGQYTHHLWPSDVRLLRESYQQQKISIFGKQ